MLSDSSKPAKFPWPQAESSAPVIPQGPRFATDAEAPAAMAIEAERWAELLKRLSSHAE